MRTQLTLAIVLTLGASLLAAGAAGCRGQHVRGDTTSLDAPAAVPAAEGILGPLDVINVRVFDEPEISGEYRIDGDGTFSFPFLGSLDVNGVTPRELGEQLAEGLGDGYIVDPVVTVFLKESHSRNILVMGSVKKPGTYPFRDGMTVVEAIALAGGVDDDGALNRTRITRRSADGEVNFTVQVSRIAQGSQPNVDLYPDDIVFVPQSPI